MAVVNIFSGKSVVRADGETSPWDLERIDQAVVDHDLDELVRALEAGTHRGRPGAPIEVKRVAVERLLLHHARARRRRFRIAMALTARPEPVARQVGSPLLASFWPEEAEAVGKRWCRLAEDEDWEVREWAAGVGATLLGDDFEVLCGQFKLWVQKGSAHLNRAIAVAARGACERRRPERVEGLLDLLQLMIDEEEWVVRKVLGTYVLGDGLLRLHPRPTLTRFRLWSKRSSWVARWTVAMALTVGSARPHSRRGLSILASMPRNEPKVAQALARAIENLQASP